MTVKVTATALRSNLYRLLDQVLETGEPLEIARRGQTLRLVREAPRRRDLAALPAIDNLVDCTPEELAAVHWDYAPSPALFPDTETEG